jgi:hypothetical protein
MTGKSVVDTRLAADQSTSFQPTVGRLSCALTVRKKRASFCEPREESLAARNVGPIVTRGDRRWLVRVYLGCDRETSKRKYHNRTIHGPVREAQA